ncbi:hypothetical protein [Thioclava sp. GXIMD2076]|uniref:HlyD family efflux transporter periplasmic adaptor subunit n=1 Tax=Thioclava kandeliae TaxID=3070818 RepID=A0ABV1SBY0_9RHOB
MAFSTGLAGMRVFSYSAASVLGLLMVSNTLAPVLTTRSERAIVNAPSYLITAPIDGVVQGMTMNTGSRLRDGETVARIRNVSVDQAKLVELRLRVSEMTQEITQRNLRLKTFETQAAQLSDQVLRMQREVLGNLENELAINQTRIERLEATLGLAKGAAARQAKLQTAGIVSKTVAEDQLVTADIVQSQLDELQLGKRQLVERLNAARKGIIVGIDSGQVPTLQAEWRSATQAIALLKGEISTQEDGLRAVIAMRDAEEHRVSLLSETSVEVQGQSEVTTLAIEDGMAARAGDTLARAVRCDQRVIVAIFPERTASKLGPGTAMKISSPDWPEPVPAKVTSILPRTTDTEDTRYVLPFPPTERREFYVMIQPEAAPPQTGGMACGVGAWVTAELQEGTLPQLSAGVRGLLDTALAAIKPNSALAASEDTAFPRHEIAHDVASGL